uniref:Uncharacterized protein n=1 Tax=Trichobilharzia regenti TaxID=157069 RepID=A0AA85JNV3_TRIRE|nr:unnamed protein product [Trichobilharzia regenti]
MMSSSSAIDNNETNCITLMLNLVLNQLFTSLPVTKAKVVVEGLFRSVWRVTIREPDASVGHITYLVGNIALLKRLHILHDGWVSNIIR